MSVTLETRRFYRDKGAHLFLSRIRRREVFEYSLIHPYSEHHEVWSDWNTVSFDNDGDQKDARVKVTVW